MATVVSLAKQCPIALIGEGTDLSVLLLHDADIDSHYIFMRSTVMKKKPISIKHLKEKLGHDTYFHLPFIHAISGCDITSRFYGFGKPVSLWKFRTDSRFRLAAKTFSTKGETGEAIIQAGEQAIISMYGGPPGQMLDVLRCHCIFEKVSSNRTQVQI